LSNNENKLKNITKKSDVNLKNNKIEQFHELSFSEDINKIDNFNKKKNEDFKNKIDKNPFAFSEMITTNNLVTNSISDISIIDHKKDDKQQWHI
jgi:hypothetical protein